jgi:hypothetical protein
VQKTDKKGLMSTPIRLLKKVFNMPNHGPINLTPKEQLELQMGIGQSNYNQQLQHQASQLAGQANNYNQYQNTWGISGQTATVGNITTQIVGGGGGMAAGGTQQGFYPNIQQPFIAPTQPSLDFQVDMIFAAVEKHLRKLIREELARAARSLHESETEV